MSEGLGEDDAVPPDVGDGDPSDGLGSGPVEVGSGVTSIESVGLGDAAGTESVGDGIGVAESDGDGVGEGVAVPSDLLIDT